jgi:hypothetical protein
MLEYLGFPISLGARATDCRGCVESFCSAPQTSPFTQTVAIPSLLEYGREIPALGFEQLNM